MSEPRRFVTSQYEEVHFYVDECEYVLRRATAAAGRKYREASFAGAEMDYDIGDDRPDKKATIRKMQAISGVEAVLVSECCFLLPGNSPVPLSAVEGWPGEITKWAHDEIRRISPWLVEQPTDGLVKLREQRDRLDKRINELEKANPKA